jgi:exonuclease SbcC
MTLSISQLRQQVAKHFPKIEKVSDSVIRFTRDAGDLPFAIYYLDVAEDLPSTQESLTKYQDQIIGKRYFEDTKSLQWSNYLYFILSKKHMATSEARRAKELIESDRSYARKFVITEDEIERVLEPQVLGPVLGLPKTNILSTWTSRLVEAGIDKAIFSDEDIPKRLLHIETAVPARPGRQAALQPAADVKAAPFMSSLRLNHYREFPLKHVYEFGTVNLIYGPNATGKTSLLEAIEWFYCGRNYRNPNRRDRYEITAVFADGRTEKATQHRKLQEFRRHHLEWYGQSEVKTNDLYRSFSQFNFLNTDAAASLADSTEHIEDDLSKLLVGPDTSKTWHNIERVREALAGQLRNLRPLAAQMRSELVALESLLKEAKLIDQESDAIRTRLEKMLRRLHWECPKGDSDKMAAKIIAVSSELATISGQAEQAGWITSPSSIDGMVTFCREAKSISSKVESDIEVLGDLLNSQQDLTDSIVRMREALSCITEVRSFFTVGVPKLSAERTKLQAAVATHSNQLAGWEEAFLDIISKSDSNATVSSRLRAAHSSQVAANEAFLAKQVEYSKFVELRSQSERLLQQLREVARAIVRDSKEPNECPLCHTRFKSGELEKHMQQGVDRRFEQRGQTLLTQMRQCEDALRDATYSETAIVWFSAFCQRSGFAGDEAIGKVSTYLLDTNKRLMTLRNELEAVNRTLSTFEAQDYSIKEYELLLSQLAKMGYAIKDESPAAVTRSASIIERDVERSLEKLETASAKANELRNSLAKALSSKSREVSELRGALSRLKERLATTQSIYSRLSSFLKSCPWPASKPIAGLRIAADSVRKMAAELQAAFGREKLAKSTYDESKKRRDWLARQLADSQPRIDHYERAYAVLDELCRKHSLTAAMKSALERNRTEIEAIFTRIHSPNEFSGLGQTITTLVRKSSAAPANLGEISTGQRAAFGLSVFLAQNSQLTVAPPVVLIDDPIAHVDDLNSLSFLDFLREVAISGRRQIFFATASDKLATLFERKFDFFGPKGFRRFNLSRESPGRTVQSLH